MNELTSLSQHEIDELAYQNWEPSHNQKAWMACAESMMPRMTIRTISQKTKIDPSTFHKWCKHDKNFNRWWNTLHKDIAVKHLAGATAALVRKANSGDVAAIRLLAEMAGAIGRDHRIEVSGPGGKPLQSVNAHLVALPTEALLKLKDMFKEILTHQDIVQIAEK